MARQSEKDSGYTLDIALRKVGEARTTEDEVRADEATRLARELVSRHAGQATLREMVFAIHGFDLAERPRNQKEEAAQEVYARLKGKFYGAQEGQPIALIGTTAARYGMEAGRPSPLWIGQVVDLAHYVTEERNLLHAPYYTGTSVMKVAHAHHAAWTEGADHPNRFPTYSDAAAFVEVRSEFDAELLLADSRFDVPGRATLLDGQGGDFAIGWNDILSRSKDVYAGDAAAQLLLGRVVDVMAAFEQPARS